MMNCLETNCIQRTTCSLRKNELNYWNQSKLTSYEFSSALPNESSNLLRNLSRYHRTFNVIPRETRIAGPVRVIVDISRDLSNTYRPRSLTVASNNVAVLLHRASGVTLSLFFPRGAFHARCHDRRGYVYNIYYNNVGHNGFASYPGSVPSTAIN